ncbi:MAG: hypothetical protein QNJ47_01450 [Nostocaceae cyanobacterium]|nr:hypothetical protein [Nostocaceae cyanobacterium]
MIQVETKFCFCSLALGKKYRSLALLLARDIAKYSPNTYFVILTDKPTDFTQQENVLAFKHRQKGVKCYHDKRFVIAKALSLYNSCIFMDADMRILAPVPQNIKWIQEPGITARGCEIMTKKHAKAITGNAKERLRREFKVTQNAADKLNLEIENPNIKFVYEYLFAVTKDSGREIEFLKQWDKIAPYFELNGVYDAEGNAIGLAAAKASLPVRWSEMEGISFFKDRTELIRIKKGQSKMHEMSIYFEEQRMIEHAKGSILEKVILKISKNIRYLYSVLHLKVFALSNFDFYYRS